MRLSVRSVCILGAGVLAPFATTPARALPRPAVIEARLVLGHDSNLLDISDFERQSFETRAPGTVFAVNRMSDQFVQGEVEVEWQAPRSIVGRPRFGLSWERRQYLHSPIKNEDRLRAGLRVRLAKGTDVELQGGFRPQVYNRHRFHAEALEAEAQFRPEVYRRWDIDLGVGHDLDRRTSLDALLESSSRRYRAPFEERDRESFGGGAGITRSLGGRVEVRGGVRYRATWTRNDPWDPDDRSHRDWRALSGITFGQVLSFKSVSLDVELEWRRFTSTNPDDQDHFGRRDRGGEAELQIVRSLTRSLDWISRAGRRWRSSDFPSLVVDEDGPFEETVVRTGVVWTWKQP